MTGNDAGRIIIDVYGDPLTSEMLPPTDIVRWVSRRKVQLVCAVRGALLSRQEACDRYGISEDELSNWEKLLDDHGPQSLKVTRTQHYREATSGQADMAVATSEAGATAEVISNGRNF